MGIRILKHKGYEYRARDAKQKRKEIQRWVCRVAKCKGRVDIKIDDIENPQDGATILIATGHCHLPIEEEVKEESQHLITDSVLHDPDISRDFRNGQNIVHSSPVADKAGRSSQSEESTRMFSTGKLDVRGFKIRAFCKPS